jgi:hypothetical protein
MDEITGGISFPMSSGTVPRFEGFCARLRGGPVPASPPPRGRGRST